MSSQGTGPGRPTERARRFHRFGLRRPSAADGLAALGRIPGIGTTAEVPGEPAAGGSVVPTDEPEIVAATVPQAVAPSRLLRSGSGGLLRATAFMASGTLLSRLTGLLRLLVIAYALGGNRLSDAFNLANNTPNIIHDLVLGGVLAATFVPQFVDRLARRRQEEAFESISAVVTLSLVVLLAATALLALLAPFVIDLYSAGTTRPGIAGEKAVATDLLRLFSLQLLGYGAISLMTALLNTVRRFTLAAYVPVINNIVGILVLLEFASLVGHRPSLAAVQHNQHLLLLLGIGTTLGVLLQAAALVPATLRCGLKLRPVWRPRDPAVTEIRRLSTWTFGFVVANQVALFIVLAIAVHLGQAAVTNYTYAFQFFQLPYGIVAVSVMSAVTPELAHRHSSGDYEELGRQFGIGLRRMMAGILPATVGYLVLAGPLIAVLLHHGAFSQRDARQTGQLLALLAIGLPGYCTYLLCIRGLQAMRDTRTAFFLYLLENALNIVFAFLLTSHLQALGLSLSLSIAYSVSAVVALLVLRRRMAGFGGYSTVGRFVLRSAWLSVLMGLAVAAVTAGIGTSSGVGLLLRVIAGVVVGLLVYCGGAALAGDRRRRPPRRGDEQRVGHSARSSEAPR